MFVIISQEIVISKKKKEESNLQIISFLYTKIHAHTSNFYSQKLISNFRK